MLLHAVLGRQGCRLHDATTLAQARALLRERHFDLVLLDLRMPDGSGLELARELRAAAATASVPIIMVSASVLSDDQEAAMQAGCNQFLSKPVLPDVLLKAVRSATA